MNVRQITNDSDLTELVAGEVAEFSGVAYTARDAAHKRFVEAANAGRPLPIDIAGAAIYYAGPTPARKGEIIGSCGPTTSARIAKSIFKYSKKSANTPMSSHVCLSKLGFQIFLRRTEKKLLMFDMKYAVCKFRSRRYVMRNHNNRYFLFFVQFFCDFI